MIIKEFKGQYNFLSNFYRCDILDGQIIYPSVEHAYQAMKTFDMGIRETVSKLDTPGKAKRYGKTIELRLGWELIKLEVMEYFIFKKFNNNYLLKHLLLELKSYTLEEGNYWGDRFWGIDLRTGQGENHLGKILMKVRDEL